MTNPIDESQRTAVKVAGCMFLLSLIVPLLNWTFILSRFIVPTDAMNTAHNVAGNEFLFRFGIVNDLAASVIAVALALALYMILKSVNKNLARFALFLKLIEAVLLAVIVLINFIAVLMLNGLASSAVAEPEQARALVGLFLNARMSMAAIPMVFLGLNFTIFLYLLFKSGYVPRILAGFGILSYALIFMYAVLTVLSRDYSSIMIIQALCWAPSCFFELIIGMWLLIKGVNARSGAVNSL